MTEKTSNVARAVEIGSELVAIAEAIEQLAIAMGNRGIPLKVWEHSLFEELSEYRETLRTELFEMGDFE